MKRLPYIVAAVVAAMLIAGVVFYLVAVRPWVAMPDEPRERIEARFAKVEALAALPEHCQAGNAELLKAIEALESSDLNVSEIVWPRDDAGKSPEVVPWRNPKGLPPELQRAIDKLLEWNSSTGGVGDDPCGDAIDVVATLRLGMLTLATADDHLDDPRLSATLRLARELRTCGSLLRGMIGIVLARRAVDWARDRRVRPTEAFRRYRLAAAEVLPLLAREAVCTTRLVEEAFPSGGAGQLRSDDQPWYASGETTIEREILMLKQFYADRFEQASKTPNDLDALAAALNFEDREHLPPSYVVRSLALDYEPSIARAKLEIGAFDSFLEEVPAN